MADIICGYAPTKGGQLHYRMTEQHHGRVPLLLLHQTASASAMFTALMAELANDYWLIAPDTPGFGNSYQPNEPHSIKLYANAIHEMCQTLNISQAFIFGHHTGAAIATQLASVFPEFVQKLIMVGPPLLTDKQIAFLRERLLTNELDFDGRFLTDTWERLKKKSPDLPLDILYRELVLTLQAGNSYPQAYTAVFAQPFAQQLETINCPTLIIAGENDSLRASLETTLARLKNGLMQIIPDAGTFICDTHPQQLADLIRPFLNTT